MYTNKMKVELYHDCESYIHKRHKKIKPSNYYLGSWDS